MKRGAKGAISKENLFPDLGFKYIGPIDGHSIEKMDKREPSPIAFDGELSKKKIERIVVFYEDGTFKNYIE